MTDFERLLHLHVSTDEANFTESCYADAHLCYLYSDQFLHTNIKYLLH